MYVCVILCGGAGDESFKFADWIYVVHLYHLVDFVTGAEIND